MAAKIGRNEPCWCGSGKKYKTCHLDADRTGPPKPDAPTARGLLWERVLAFAMDFHTPLIAQTEMRGYFGLSLPETVASPELLVPFMLWFVFSFRKTLGAPTALEQFRVRTRGLSADDQRLLQDWAASQFTLYVVAAVVRDSGVTVEDYFTRQPTYLKDKSSSREAKIGDIILSRVEACEGGFTYVADGVRVDPAIEPDFIAQIRHASGGDNAACSAFMHDSEKVVARFFYDLLHRRVQPVQIRNSDGHELMDANAYYRVIDPAKVAQALACHPSIEAEDEQPAGGRVFTWLNRRRTQNVEGQIYLDGDQLRLSVNSKERLALGMMLLQKMAGDIIQYLRQDATPLIPRDGDLAEPEQPESPLERPSAEEILKFKALYYKHWIDDEIPALGGQTPRQACRLPSGKEMVATLLRDMRQKDSFDFCPVAAALGIEL